MRLRVIQIIVGGLLSWSAHLNAQPGTTNWTFTTGAGILSSAAVAPDGTIYFGSYDETFYAINPDGSLKWSYDLSTIRLDEFVYVFSSPAIGADGTVYFGTEHMIAFGAMAGGELHAMDPATGRPKWTKRFISRPWAAIYSDPSVAPDGTVYVGCFDTNLYAFNPDGSEKWRFKAADEIFSDVAIAPDGSIYFGCNDGRLYALDPAGNKKWDFLGGEEAEDIQITGSPSIGGDGTIYFGSAGNDGHQLHAVFPNGTNRWNFPTGGAIESSPAIGPDGVIYFGSNDKKLYALNPDGTKRWEHTVGGAVKSSPAIAADGTVYFGSFDDHLYAVDADGNFLWSAPTGANVYASPTVIDDGTVYIGSDDGLLYALEGTAGLAESDWPMFHQNQRHTAVGKAAVARPQITFIGVESGTVSLEWSAVAGVTYRLQSRPVLGAGDWADASGDIQATSGTAAWSGPTGSDSAYFRIKVQ